MVGELHGMTLKAIGIVQNKVKQVPGSGYKWQKIVSEIVLDDSLTEAMDNLDEFSHIIVLYWMHQSTEPAPVKVHPKGRAELPRVGVFASRSPDRPNPVGKATVRLLQRRRNVLTVQGLDAVDGTPVIDIKPYLPEIDSVDSAKVPSWITKH